MDKMEALDLARQTLAAEAGALDGLKDGLGEGLWSAAQAVAACPGIVWTTGVGTSSAVALRLAHILTDCGVRSMFLSPDLGLHGHSGAMVSGEVLIALSRGGLSEEVNLLVSIARARGLTTIALLHDEASPLAKLCDLVVAVRTPPELELGGYCATTSSLAVSAVGDALCAIVLHLTGYSPSQLAQTHPGGAVGRALGSLPSKSKTEKQ